MRLKDRTFIITGGSIGIGFEIAKKCVQEGAKVVIASRNKSDLEKAKIELNKLKENSCFAYSLDISNIDKVRQFADWCGNNFPEINGMVNNAGIYGPIGKTTEVSMEQFTEAININFLGTVYMCNMIAPMLKSGTKKKIVNMSGGGAATPFANYSAYATSKIAIVRFTENLAQELQDENFDVNCVAPGFVVTRLHEQTIKAGNETAGNAFYEMTKKQIESGGVPAEKAANLIVYLLSEESNGITGKFISAPWDPWDKEDFQNLLRNDKDFATLRRIDNKTFFKKT